jgi:hypothetical protein
MINARIRTWALRRLSEWKLRPSSWAALIKVSNALAGRVTRDAPLIYGNVVAAADGEVNIPCVEVLLFSLAQPPLAPAILNCIETTTSSILSSFAFLMIVKDTYQVRRLVSRVIGNVMLCAHVRSRMGFCARRKIVSYEPSTGESRRVNDGAMRSSVHERLRKMTVYFRVLAVLRIRDLSCVQSLEWKVGMSCCRSGLWDTPSFSLCLCQACHGALYEGFDLRLRKEAAFLLYEMRSRAVFGSSEHFRTWPAGPRADLEGGDEDGNEHRCAPGRVVARSVCVFIVLQFELVFGHSLVFHGPDLLKGEEVLCSD